MNCMTNQNNLNDLSNLNRTQSMNRRVRNINRRIGLIQR